MARDEKAALTARSGAGTRPRYPERAPPASVGTRERPGPGDVATRESLVENHLPLVRRLCMRFRHVGEPMDDLVQIGSVGLLKAIDKFDPQRGFSFMTYAVPVIVGEIKNYLRDHGWAVKVPRRLQKNKLAVHRAADGLTQVLGRSPTVAEIATATDLTQEEVYDTFEVGAYGRPLSLRQNTPETAPETRYPCWSTWEGRSRPTTSSTTAWTSPTLSSVSTRERRPSCT